MCAGAPKWLVANPSGSNAKFKLPQSTSQRIESFTFEAAPTAPVDLELREFLREWRKTTARENKIAAFIVLHDTTLDELCRLQPKTLAEIRRISGMGEKKCELYGDALLRALREYQNGARASKEAAVKPSSPSHETLDLLRKGHTFEELSLIHI